MKKIILISCISVLCFACRTEKATRSPEAIALRNELQNIAKQGFMFGHHDDLMYGIGWWGDSARSDVQSVCGDYPAIFSFDVGDLEHGSEVNLDKVPFSKIRTEIIKHYERGGITTLSWHTDNPATGGDAWDISDTAVVSSILPKGKNHEKFLGWLGNLADFFNSITTADGTKIPIIFRPWHEHTGSWFWWGQNFCSTDEYKNLWKMTYDFMQQRDVNQLLYAYSPGQEPNSITEYLERYPADEIIDILGTDVYQFNAADYKFNLDKMLNIITLLGKEKNKPVALTETGFEAIPDSVWWTETLLPLVEKYPISYLVVWRNAYERSNHFYAPFPGQISANDFVIFYQNNKTVFLSEMKKNNK
ncbi:mannan endo-1,4-beta-mannosidase [Bacteroidia bacterium]|nr:mannan endo-1,4-beta-mannosidase [Bacteroidia bacterium]